MVSYIWVEIKSNVWRGSYELIQLLCLFSVHGKANKDAAPAAEPVEIKTSESEEKVMTKTMHIEGMMCGHCEATVKKALEALPEVTSAEVSHEAGTAVVTLSSEVADDVLKKTVEEKDYKVTAIDYESYGGSMGSGAACSRWRRVV